MRAGSHEAVTGAGKTVEGVHGIGVQDHTARVEDGSTGENEATVDAAFPVRDDRERARTTERGYG